MTNFNLEPIKKEVEVLVDDFSDVQPIISEEEYLQAGDGIKMLKSKVKKLENKRIEWTKPILESKKKIDDDFKEVLKPLKEVISIVEDKMKVFWRKEKERLDEKQKKIEAEAIKQAQENKQNEVSVEVVNDKKSIRGEMSSTTYQEKWTYKIIDDSKVPIEFLEVSDKKVKEAIKAGKREITGLEIFDEGTIISK